MNALKKFLEPRRQDWPWQKLAMFWGGSMFVFTQVTRALRPMPFSLIQLVFDIVIWTLAGIAFGLAMRGFQRWWAARGN